MRFLPLTALAAAMCACSEASSPEGEAPLLPAPVPITLPDPITPLPLGNASAPPSAASGELTIQYIQRFPITDFVWQSANPAADGWPAPGQNVTWRASVKNWFASPVTVSYRWLLGSTQVGAGTMSIAPRSTGTADYSMPWSFDRRELSFVIDPASEIAEEEEENNRLTVFTDALSVAFYVEQSFYDFFRANQYKLQGAHSTSFEDWAHRQIYFYNEIFRRAIYPEIPDGVLDRLRLDKIVIVADGSIANPNIPAPQDRTVDLQTGFRTSSVTGPQYSSTAVTMNNQAYYSGVTQHELGHARGLIDVHGFDVYDGIPGHQVALSAANAPLVGSAWMPAQSVTYNGVPGYGITVGEPGMMHNKWTFMDRYSAAMWNQMKGRRAVTGNYNPPFNIGWFMNQMLPSNTRLIIGDQNGRRLTRANVELYKAKQIGTGPVPYGRLFGPIPDEKLTTDEMGEVDVGRVPFSNDPVAPAVRHTSAFSNAVLLVAIEKSGKRGYAFVQVPEFNYQYLAGRHSDAKVVVRVNMH